MVEETTNTGNKPEVLGGCFCRTFDVILVSQELNRTLRLRHLDTG